MGIRKTLDVIKKAKNDYSLFMSVYPLTTNNLLGEEWHKLADESYQISNFGRLKSFRRRKTRILKPRLIGQYLMFDLRHSKIGARMLAHRLVAQAFIPNYNNKPEVNHKDGLKWNNHVSNLEWVTSSENQLHAINLNLQGSGQDSANAKLTNAQAVWIRSVYKPYDKKFGKSALAKLFNVSPRTIYHIIKGLTYKNTLSPNI